MAFLAALWPLISIVSLAQKTIEYNNQQWMAYNNQLKLSKKLTLFSDFGMRRTNYFEQFSQITMRTGLGYPIYGNIQGLTGFACFQTFRENKLTRIELRPFQDISTNQNLGKITLHNRIRIEARHFNDLATGEVESRSSFNFRFRYRILFGIPFLNIPTKNNDSKLIFNIGDEIMINAGKQIVYNVLDNNRLLIGATYQVRENISFIFLYNFQIGRNNMPASFRQSDIFWLVLQHKISLVKKSNS